MKILDIIKTIAKAINLLKVSLSCARFLRETFLISKERFVIMYLVVTLLYN